MKEGETGERGYLISKLSVPVGENSFPHHLGPLALGGYDGEDGGGVGETIQGHGVPDLRKPGGSGRDGGISQDLPGTDLENVSWVEPGHHSKQSELAAVKGGLNGEAASKQIDSSPGCPAVQSLESLHGDLVVEGEDIQLALV